MDIEEYKREVEKATNWVKANRVLLLKTSEIKDVPKKFIEEYYDDFTFDQETKELAEKYINYILNEDKIYSLDYFSAWAELLKLIKFTYKGETYLPHIANDRNIYVLPENVPATVNLLYAFD